MSDGHRIFGERNAWHKLTEAQVRHIRSLRVWTSRIRLVRTGRGIPLATFLAKRYHVTPTNIRCIWAGRSWTHLTP